ncbi:hypothetical protein DENSPDRAFT_789601 [Dentipellis sp. KUC8613]|nr:hypothetical protein DENSPDRAFT_789601 [Dentipellis sp. KUC8613]
MYLVGIIPGPDKPSVEDIYHALDLIVDDFNKLWSPGIWLSRTAKYFLGRLTKGAVIPLISDMLAARQVAGYGSATSTFFCTCCRLDKPNIENLDKSSWEPRDPDHDKKCAEKWRDASSRSEQAALFKLHGIRWSPLYRLPYWNPSRYVDIDTMHALDLGLIQTHCREAWGINMQTAGGDGTALRKEKVPPRPSHHVIVACIELIRENADNLYNVLSSDRFKVPVLWHICNDNNLRRAGAKKQLARTIVEWVNMDVDESSLEGSVASKETAGTNDNLADLSVRSESENDKIRRGAKMLATGSAQKTGLGKIENLDLLHFITLIYSTVLQYDERIPPPEDAPPTEDAPPADTTESTHVLGKEIMEAIHSDMQHTVLPSWVNKPPADWGTTKRSKLSANHWRVIATVHLPITLVRLWGHKDAPARKRDMLNNFIDLMYAVQLANLREVSLDHIVAYRERLHRYLEDYKRLFKENKIKPIHHVAQHVDEFMLRFGPNHSHSAPFYERHIYQLQEQNVNNKFGELEATMMVASVRAANLRALLSAKSELSGSIQGMIKAYNLVKSEDTRGTRLASMLSTDGASPDRTSGKDPTFRLSNQTHDLLRQVLSKKSGSEVDPDVPADSPELDASAAPPRKAWSHTQIAINGVRFATHSKFYRDSHIMFLDDTVQRAGQIQEIFTIRDPPHHQPGATTSTFLVIKDFEMVSDVKANLLELQEKMQGELPGSNLNSMTERIKASKTFLEAFEPIDSSYRRLGSLCGFLCNTHQFKLRVIEEEAVLSHFAGHSADLAMNHGVAKWYKPHEIQASRGRPSWAIASSVMGRPSV